MIQTTDAVILRSNIFRETSQLLTFLTQDFGKIHTLAKGVRNRPDRFGSTFELFSCNRIVFYERNRSGLQLLSQCDLIDPFPPIRPSLEKTACALYFIELVDRMTAWGDRNKRLYSFLLEGLRQLSKEIRIREMTRIFEVKLLSLSGLMPEVSRCQRCGGKGGEPFVFSFRKGGILCASCLSGEDPALPLSRGTLASLQHIASSPWERASRIRISQKAHAELEEILRRFIDFHLDERIRSRDFLKELGL